MELEISDQMTLKEYRKHYRKHHEEFLREKKKTHKSIEDVEFMDEIAGPQSVNMREIQGTNGDVANAIDRLYANDGR
jgi:hypothetical protein